LLSQPVFFGISWKVILIILIFVRGRDNSDLDITRVVVLGNYSFLSPVQVMLTENSMIAPGDRNVPAIVSQSIRDAMRLTGIRPLTSVDSLQRDLAAETETLTLAYQQQVVEDIQTRLSRDPDYSSRRFPNTAKYFQGEK
jgi:hypothetical protein